MTTRPTLWPNNLTQGRSHAPTSILRRALPHGNVFSSINSQSIELASAEKFLVDFGVLGIKEGSMHVQLHVEWPSWIHKTILVAISQVNYRECSVLPPLRLLYAYLPPVMITAAPLFSAMTAISAHRHPPITTSHKLVHRPIKSDRPQTWQASSPSFQQKQQKQSSGSMPVSK
jgi:hypothetical protein